MTADTRIAIFGDWHGATDWVEIILPAIAAAGITQFIHVGDHGAYWPLSRDHDPLFHGPIPAPSPFTTRNIELAAQLGLEGIILDGNHDNHTALRALPIDTDGFGIISPNLRYARRGSRLAINGKRFGFLGGAFSINYRNLIPEVSLWLDKEQTTPADVRALGTGTLDVLITHDVPTGTDTLETMQIPEFLELRSRETRDLIRQAVDNTNPALVFSGHWHQRRTHQLNTRTRIEILDKEFMPGNAVILDTATMNVSPFEEE